MKNIFKQFKDFILQGDVVMLAVAVVIGLAFQAVVKAIVTDILTPIIGIFGKTNFEGLSFTIHGSRFSYGDVLNEIIAFLATAAAVFIFIVKPHDVLMARALRNKAATTKSCPACITDIPVAATRCPACTTELPAASAA